MAVTANPLDYFRAQLYEPTQAEVFAQTQLWLPLGNIVEIVTVQRQDICPLPGLAAGVLGVTNLRGQLIWLVDLRAVRQRLPSQRFNPQEKLTVILLQSPQGQGLVGCLVTLLQGIVSVESTVLQGVGDDWQMIYPFCDRLGQWGDQQGFILNLRQLFDYLQRG